MELIWIVAECPYPPNSGGRIVTWNRLNIFAKKYFNPNNIDEKISSTEHLNILNEYKDEIKGLLLNKKNSE